ncbi:MAG: alpha/beta fold hydrolase [Deltaproteobacteria bacterium]|nr:alpha/beta fold hydrolase [Deltaproteobacteria bacterium]
MEARGRTLEETRTEILRRAGRVNPFERVRREDVEEVLGRLSSLDPDPWGVEWGKIGARYESLGDEQEKRGERDEAGKSYYLAYPRGLRRPPVVMHWGGVDGWKEDARGQSEALHRLGLATFTIDMPGAGENPLLGHEPRAERTFSTAMDYLAGRDDVDGRRIAVMGRSFGGYWAAKMAYVEAKRLRGAVNWGAGAHLTFQPEWLRPALTERASQYLMGPASLLDARAYIFRAKSLEEVLRIAPQLSLKTQGLWDQPNAPLLLINGKNDDQHPVEDIYLLLEHGSPKDVRIFAGAGHMGRVPGQPNREVLETVCGWLKRRLGD